MTLRALIDFPNGLAIDTDTAPQNRWQAQFANPLHVLAAWRAHEVPALLEQVQAHALAGRWCVGEVAYEAAGAFDAALLTQAARAGWPLARFAVFDQALPWCDDALAPGNKTVTPGATPWQFATTALDYANKVERARQAMAAGECYQINLTEAMRAELTGADPQAAAKWFARLRQAQPGGYLAWLDWGDQQVLSLSPELFFDWRPHGAQGVLTCQPMKGTASRHADPLLDAQARQHLQSSDKERAENVMIVDLLRNDMGRVAEPGSVQVSRLFEVQALPTVWQMTSTITATTRADVGLPEVFGALFPCGSVTGAPKARAMHWIKALEPEPRGVYCGAVGVVRPGGLATFNVPIRTVTLERTHAPEALNTWCAHYGVGSAITFYAEPRAEWQELAAKTRFLERASTDFDLLETLRLQDGHYTLLQAHLDRMGHSAANFGFVWHSPAALACLQTVAQQHPGGVYRVRLTWSCTGQPQAQAFELAPSPELVIFNLADQPLESAGREHEFITHKTTRRHHYDERLKPEPGVFDTLLFNERGEITEFTRGNVALKLGGVWLTPDLASGLLAGTCRAELLTSGKITPAVLTLADLQRAGAVAFFNSVRGWLAAQPSASMRASLKVPAS